LNRERGITLVLVTHEPDIAEYASASSFSRMARSNRTTGRDQRNAAEELKNLPVIDERRRRGEETQIED
jgi:hypothetical protein